MNNFIQQQYNTIKRKYPFFNRKLIPFIPVFEFKLSPPATHQQKNIKQVPRYEDRFIHYSKMGKKHLDSKRRNCLQYQKLDKKLNSVVKSGKFIYLDLNTQKNFYIDDKKMSASSQYQFQDNFLSIGSQKLLRYLQIQRDTDTSIVYYRQRIKQAKQSNKREQLKKSSKLILNFRNSTQKTLGTLKEKLSTVEANRVVVE